MDVILCIRKTGRISGNFLQADLAPDNPAAFFIGTLCYLCTR
jgi:hypothetical protein